MMHARAVCDGAADAACPGRCDATCGCLPGDPDPSCGDDLAPCDDGDRCTIDDRCMGGFCESQITTTDGIVCRFDTQHSKVCGEEPLPVSLENLIARRRQRLGHMLEKAEQRAAEERPARVKRLRARAIRQLGVIAQRAERAERARKAARRISPVCRQQLDAMRSGVSSLIETFSF